MTTIIRTERLDNYGSPQDGTVLRGPGEEALSLTHEQYLLGNREPSVYFGMVKQYGKEHYIVPVYVTVAGYVESSKNHYTKLITGQVWIPEKPYCRDRSKAQLLQYEGDYNPKGRVGRFFYGESTRIPIAPGMVLARTDEIYRGYNGIQMITPGNGMLVKIKRFDKSPAYEDKVITEQWEPQHGKTHEQWYDLDSFLIRYFTALPPLLGEAMWNKRTLKAL